MHKYMSQKDAKITQKLAILRQNHANLRSKIKYFSRRYSHIFTIDVLLSNDPRCFK